MPVKFTRIVCLCLLGTLGLSTSARAQGYISPLIGFDFGGDAGCPKISNCKDKTLNAGVGLGKMNSLFGIEEEFAYARNFFGDAPQLSSSVLTVMTSAMVAPRIGPFRPYALGGAGLIKTHVEFTPSSLLAFDGNHVGWNVGGGLIVSVGPKVGLRGEIRHVHSFRDLNFLGFSIDNEKLDFGRASAALVVTF